MLCVLGSAGYNAGHDAVAREQFVIGLIRRRKIKASSVRSRPASVHQDGALANAGVAGCPWPRRFSVTCSRGVQSPDHERLLFIVLISVVLLHDSPVEHLIKE